MAFEVVVCNSQLHLRSPLPPAEAERLITAGIDFDDGVANMKRELDGTRDVIGMAANGVLRLRVRFPSSYSFYGALMKPMLDASIRAEGAGSVIEGTFACHAFGRGFVKFFCWSMLGVLSLFAVLAVIKYALGTSAPGAWQLLVWIPLVIGAGALYGRAVRRHAQEDIAQVTQYLRNTVQSP